jgi:hypothetical protein
MLRRCAAATWIRFHALPGSRRYPEDDEDRAEILRRHACLLAALAPDRGEVLVLTCSWSEGPAPIARDAEVAAASPDATYWRSVAGEESWTHVHVATHARTALDALLGLVMDDRAGGVIIAPPDLTWLYHPYDGGADVIARSPEERVRLRETFRDWLSRHRSRL